MKCEQCGEVQEFGLELILICDEVCTKCAYRNLGKAGLLALPSHEFVKLAVAMLPPDVTIYLLEEKERIAGSGWLRPEMLGIVPDLRQLESGERFWTLGLIQRISYLLHVPVRRFIADDA